MSIGIDTLVWVILGLVVVWLVLTILRQASR